MFLHILQSPQSPARGKWGCRGRSRLGGFGLEGTDLGTKLFHRSFVWLDLANGRVITGSWIEQAEKADGVHWPELVGEDRDSLAIKLNGIGVSRVGAHEISGGGELDRIENRDGQVHGMLDCTAEKLVVGSQHRLNLQGLRGGEVEGIETLEAEAVQLDSALADG